MWKAQYCGSNTGDTQKNQLTLPCPTRPRSSTMHNELQINRWLAPAVLMARTAKDLTIEFDPHRTDQPDTELADTDLSWRIVNTTNIVRLVVAVFLLGSFFGGADSRFVGDRYPALFAGAATVYLVYGITSAFLIRGRLFALPTQIFLQLVVDIGLIVIVMHASGGISSGIGGLLVIFVAAASLARPSQTPYFVPAVATLVLLAEQAFSQLGGSTTGSDYTATGILGAILFAIPLLTRPVANRLSESEALAAQRGVDLANMSKLNQYIVQHLRESIVAIDGNDHVRLLNESAAKMLGVTTETTGIPLSELSPQLSRHVATWRNSGYAHPPRDFTMATPDGSSSIDINIAPFAQADAGPSPALLFMEDAGILAERVQQSKLASLGRLSASIAHEIRNPVGAMSHAGQLLAESNVVDESNRRLIKIILSHSERVSHIIDNILQLSRRDTGQREEFALQPWLRGFVSEFIRTLELNESELSVTGETTDIVVLMDRSHLRQILWNLCDNAVKYASDKGGIMVELRAGRVTSTNRPFLEVVDCGTGVEPQMVDNIFEPFFTAQPGGTGLGLYISRELCELNRAALSYRPRKGGGSIFRIVFSDPSRWTGEP